MIDRAMSSELVEEWLPDFIALEALSPTHPDREPLYEQAVKRVTDSYSYYGPAGDNISGSGDSETQMECAHDVIEILLAVAGWLSANQVERSV